ncbi:hypothetical protein LIER_30606 [Lithospermum erythrorhizon]|uniref:Uncharacterized protein n=1 Tax=Lithospermum erythrorhizon TaxID=34254 RepID=A0AAV3RN90_LITER
MVDPPKPTEQPSNFGGSGGGTTTKPDHVDPYGYKSKLLYTHCHRQGHDITTCFLKIGYPEFWETRFRRGLRAVARMRGVVQTVFGGVACARGEFGPMPSLTPDQWHRLMSLFGNSNTPSANDR